MSKQVWGTFSVKDHGEPNAFVAEVMLYDRLVIPVPADDADERARWEEQGWQPQRLDTLLRILGARAYPVKWDSERQRRWKSRYDSGSEIARDGADWAFMATRTELTAGLPRYVTGIQAVTNYTSMQELEKDLRLVPSVGAELPVYGGATVAILGHEFLVPDDPGVDHDERLRQAVSLSSEPSFLHKRASFWRWQREFLDDKGMTDLSSIQAAVEEMHDLIEDEKATVRKAGVRTGIQFAFLIGSVSLGLLGGPLTAIAVGGAFVSVGQFVADRLLNPDQNQGERPAALFRDSQKHFRWD